MATKTFEIYFHNLNKEAQEELCEEFGTTPEEENWDTMALTIFEREEEGE